MAAACGASGALYGLLAYFTGCACIYSCFYRTKLRQQYMLPESPCGDCLVHFCCDSCALCQEYRELKNRGFDMSIGKVICNTLSLLWSYFWGMFLILFASCEIFRLARKCGEAKWWSDKCTKFSRRNEPIGT